MARLFDRIINSLGTVIKQAIDNRLKDVHTSMPGIIVAFDSATQTATVQPAIRRIFRTLDGEDKEQLTPVDLPQCINVPVVFPRAAGFSLTFPVEPGDECLINFTERDIDNWHLNGGVKSPNAKRMHSLSDAIAFVGIASQPNKILNFDPNNLQLRDLEGDCNITIFPDNNMEINAPTELRITAPLVKIVGDIEHTGTQTTTVDVIAGGNNVSLVNHVNTGVVSGGSNTGPPP